MFLMVVDAQGGDVEAVDGGPDHLVHGVGLVLVAQPDGPELQHRGDDEAGEHLVADVLGQEQGEGLLLLEQGLFRVLGDEEGQQQAETQDDDQQGPGDDPDELERAGALLTMVLQ
jgi:hypothetical protein